MESTIIREKASSFAEIFQCVRTEKRSLHSTVEFLPNQLIAKFDAKDIHKQPNYLTVQVSENQHIMLNPEFLQYINHSCAPNVLFNPQEGTVTALRKIEAGEEFTFFYPSTEWSMNQGFDCECGSEACLGFIQGAAHIPIDLLQERRLSSYIQTKLAN